MPRNGKPDPCCVSSTEADEQRGGESAFCHTDLRYRRLKVRELSTGRVIDDEADVLVSARGFLSDPAWPKVPGLKSFQGEVMHSARWNEE